MSTFTPKDICRDQCLGIAVIILSLVMAITGAICFKQNIGTPEYIISLRNTGWTLLVLGSLWTALATWKRLSL